MSSTRATNPRGEFITRDHKKRLIITVRPKGKPTTNRKSEAKPKKSGVAGVENRASVNRHNLFWNDNESDPVDDEPYNAVDAPPGPAGNPDPLPYHGPFPDAPVYPVAPTYQDAPTHRDTPTHEFAPTHQDTPTHPTTPTHQDALALPDPCLPPEDLVHLTEADLASLRQQ